MALRLRGAVQSYDWGGASTSAVGALAALNSGVAADPAKPYAEFWCAQGHRPPLGFSAGLVDGVVPAVVHARRSARGGGEGGGSI